MKKLVLLLLFVMYNIFCFSRQIPVNQDIYTQHEVNLMFQLQQNQIETLKSDISSHVELIDSKIQGQDKVITANNLLIANHIGMYSWWMTFMSIGAAIVIAFISWFFNWKSKNNLIKIKQELQQIQSIKDAISTHKAEIETKYEEIEKLCKVIKDKKGEVEDNALMVEGLRIKTLSCINQIDEVSTNKHLEEKKEEINTLVNEVREIKSDDELTAEDWFLKGYNAQLKNKNVDACFYYMKSTELNTNHHISYYNWGIALHDLAKLKSDASLFEESCAKYQKAVELKPDYLSAYNNWGIALSDLAKLKSDASIFEQSCAKYQKVVELEPDDSSAYYNWGNALSELAKLKSDASIFEQSFEKYKKAVELKPDYSSAYNNWGIALSDLAVLKSDVSIFEESFEKYKKAKELESNDCNIYDNWGCALLEYTRINDSLSTYKDQIEAILLQGNAINERSCLYNLSCLYARLDEKDKAITMLEKNLQFDLNSYSRKYIESDLDFHNIKSDPDFIAILDKYYPNT